MTEQTGDNNKLMIGLTTGVRVGFVGGVGIAILSLIAAALLKGLITNFTGVWPEWFSGAYLVDFILSRWWIVIIVVSCTVAGAIVGALTRKRYELL